MSKRLTTEEFIEKAKRIYGDKYDYSLVKYEHSKKKVCIICPIHGKFMKKPNAHLNGEGCIKCSYEKKRSNVLNIGIYDLDESSTIYDRTSYRYWYNMFLRCYGAMKRKTYEGCSVCNEWHKFSNFKRWFDKHYVKRWHIDKDILIKGNKEYSPESCCFVPSEINSLFTKRGNNRGKLPIGVTRVSQSNKYQANVDVGFGSRLRYLGCYDTPEDAFIAYKAAKEKRIKEVANKWKDKLEPRVYKAMMNYQVEITD